MTETTNTTARSNPATTGALSMYLVRDAAVNTRNRSSLPGARVAKQRASEQRRKLGNALLQIGLAHQTGTVPADWRIGRTRTGEPVIDSGPNSESGLRISLSHSREFVAAGICDSAAIGIDIECYGGRRFTAIARHLDWPRATWDPPGSLDADGFYHLWTLWEAAIKSASAGSSAQFKSVFERFLGEIEVGRPGAALSQDWFSASWTCAELFWLTLLAKYSRPPDVRMFLVDGLESTLWSARITEISSENGRLNQELFQ